MSLYDRRLLLFTGKGGVGKTTIASSFALSCARRGERTLLMELNVQDRVSSYFGSKQIGEEIVEVEDNLHAVNVTPEAAMEEYGMMILRVKLIYRAVFENRIVESFLQAIPGLDDLLMIGKAWFHATERQSDGEHVWDKVIVDAPATGHGIFLLQIPSVITSTLNSGRMHDEAEKIFKFLNDPQKTALALVTLAEDMPVNETLMLRQQAIERLEIPVGGVIANGLYPRRFGDQQSRWIESAHNSEIEDDGLAGMVRAAVFRQQRRALQKRYLRELRDQIDEPLYRVPFHFEDRITYPVIESIAERLHQEIVGESLNE